MQNRNWNESTRLDDEIPGEAVQRDGSGWLIVVAGLLLVMIAVFAGGTLWGPTEHATIATNTLADGTRAGVGNTPPPTPPGLEQKQTTGSASQSR